MALAELHVHPTTTKETTHRFSSSRLWSTCCGSTRVWEHSFAPPMFILFGAETRVSSSSTQLVHHTNLQWCLDSGCFRDSCPLRDWPSLPGNRDLSLRKHSLHRITSHDSFKYGRAFVIPFAYFNTALVRSVARFPSDLSPG